MGDSMKGTVNTDEVIKAIEELHAEYGLNAVIPLRVVQEKYPHVTLQTLRDTMAICHPEARFERPRQVSAAVRIACIKAMREHAGPLTKDFVATWQTHGCKVKVMRMWAKAEGIAFPGDRKPRPKLSGKTSDEVQQIIQSSGIAKDQADVVALNELAEKHGVGQKRIWDIYREMGGKIIWNGSDSIMGRVVALEERVARICKELGIAY